MERLKTNQIAAPSQWRVRLLPLCVVLLSPALPLAAQSLANAPTYRYRAVDLGTLGGPNGYGCVPDCRYANNQGITIFAADTAAPDPFQTFCLFDCYAAVGVEWRNGQQITLNPLAGGVDTRPFWLSDSGLVSGISENGLLDPTTGAPELLATLWRGGVPTNLGTFGGTSSLAFAVNDSGQVVGGASTTVPETLPNPFWELYTYFPVSTQTHAFLWNDGALHDLGTLGGPDSFAAYVNEIGQVAGYSFTNGTPNVTTGFPTLDPFFWSDGKMQDLGTLGGTFGYANGLNDQGHVIGQSNLAGDATYHPFLWQTGHMIDLKTLGGNNGASIWINDAGAVAGWADLTGSQVHHAFLWQRGKMTDLGTVGTDPCSTAYAVNASGQVVGDSGDGSGIETCGPKLHGFIWEHGGPMVDLNTLFAPLASGLTFQGAGGISDSGEIFGFGTLSSGDTHVILLIPCDANHEDGQACHAGAAEVTEAKPSAQ